jgi:transcription-repair coupling factor (superfamily II helicase)
MRALLQQLGPDTATNTPVIIRRGSSLDPDELMRTLINGGYRREELVEHRGEVARRGAIVDIFPSTADAPIRIDLWGDEVDRLTTFSVHDQRSDDDLEEFTIFPARELILNDAVRARASSFVASEPWGREHWERLSEGLLFDGMESWLPWLTDSDDLLTDHIGDDALIVMVYPRRMGDRARDLLAAAPSAGLDKAVPEFAKTPKTQVIRQALDEYGIDVEAEVFADERKVLARDLLLQRCTRRFITTDLRSQLIAHGRRARTFCTPAFAQLARMPQRLLGS